MPPKLSKEKVLETIKKVGNNEYELLSDYISSTKPIILKHNCGKIYTIKRAKTFLNENGCKCPECYDERKLRKNKKKPPTVSLEDFKKRLRYEYGDEYTYISGFIDTQHYVKLRHNKCGTIWKVTPYNILGKRHRTCPKCGNMSRGKYLIRENYLQELLDNKEYGNEYQWIGKYNGNNKEKIKIKHLICNNTYSVRPNDFQQGYKCPFCSNKQSDEEEFLYKIVKNLYNHKILKHYRNKYEIDIFIPSLDIGIEFNGIYWHSTIKKDEYYHINKFNYFKKKCIHVLFIEETELINNIEYVKFKISYVLNIIQRKLIFSYNDISFRIESNKNKDVNTFIEKNDSNIYKYQYSISLLIKNKIVSTLLLENNNCSKIYIVGFINDITDIYYDSLYYILDYLKEYLEILNISNISLLYSIRKDNIYLNEFLNNDFNIIKYNEIGSSYILLNKQYINFKKADIEMKNKNNSNIYEYFDCGRYLLELKI